MKLLKRLFTKTEPKCKNCNGTGWGPKYYCDFYGWNRLPCDRHESCLAARKAAAAQLKETQDED